MTECISRNDAFEAVKEKIDLTPDEKVSLIMRLAKIPAADVAERKAGKWEVDEVGCGICSACGNFAFETTTHHISGWYPRFCPNCGAKMEVPTDV